MKPAFTLLDGITGIADMTASAYIVRMENIETYNLIHLTIYCNASIRLTRKEGIRCIICQFFILRKSNTLTDNGIPYRHCLLLVCFFVSSYLNHRR